ncbi:MAG: chorismate-binding protein [Jatrophihabitans sp.]
MGTPLTGPDAVRLDDLAADPPRHWLFRDQLATGSAVRLADVVGQLAEADRQARELGRWVIVAVAYESAPAFDAALRAKPSPPAGMPFLWWAAFSDRRASDLIASTGPLPLELHRRPNVLPYAAAVEDVRRRIEAGEVYQVNVTDRVGGALRGTPQQLYEAMLSAQSAAFGALLSLGASTVVSASPELFFRWDGDTVTCRPMKGTAARRPRPADDRAAARELRASAKEQAENLMIVDLLRNDLARLGARSVRVDELFRLERYETVWQLTSTLRAEVPDPTTLVDVFRALFPCGSVTGAPKIAATAVIDELEREPRGVYCGAIGCLAPPGRGPRAVFSVPIRTAVCDHDGRLTYGVGAGITWSSDPAQEDAEVAAKAEVLSTAWPAFELLETLRRDATGAVHLGAHLDRLAESADWFAIPFDRLGAEQAVAALGRTEVARRLRLLLARDGTLTVEDRPPEPGPEVVRLATDTAVTRSDDLFCCHKTTARSHYAAALARHPDVDDVVLVNEHGRAIETTVGNLLFRLDGCWWVPPLSDGGLPGIGRRYALESGAVRERSIQAAELAGCEALAVVNDLRGRRPAELR